MPSQTPINKARFHPNLELYWYLQTSLALAASIVGIVALPVWLLIGRRWVRRYHENLSCVLGERSLVVTKGILFRSEKTVPLDQIQDVSVKHGPILDWLGLAKLNVETAGHGGSQGATAALTGVVDAIGFRDRVLEQRDLIADGRRSAPAPADPGGTAASSEHDTDAVHVLHEIRDTLARIEEALRANSMTG